MKSVAPQLKRGPIGNVLQRVVVDLKPLALDQLLRHRSSSQRGSCVAGDVKADAGEGERETYALACMMPRAHSVVRRRMIT